MCSFTKKIEVIENRTFWEKQLLKCCNLLSVKKNQHQNIAVKTAVHKLNSGVTQEELLFFWNLLLFSNLILWLYFWLLCLWICCYILLCCVLHFQANVIYWPIGCKDTPRTEQLPNAAHPAASSVDLNTATGLPTAQIHSTQTRPGRQRCEVTKFNMNSIDSDKRRGAVPIQYWKQISIRYQQKKTKK